MNATLATTQRTLRHVVDGAMNSPSCCQRRNERITMMPFGNDGYSDVETSANTLAALQKELVISVQP
jgi:hypothetical protein